MKLKKGFIVSGKINKINKMNNSLLEILKHRKILFSQSGEDGVLEYVLDKIPNKDNWCVEFGAWDGIHLSNTYHFISQKNYNSVLIEGETDRWKTLCLNMEKFNSICINKFVDFEGENTLDNIFATTAIPKNFDLLSIDIDGNDYYVWDSLDKYKPKVVIIEINIRNKPNEYIINEKNSDFKIGISGTGILPLTELAEKKGYSLIANISCNAIYVSNEFYSLFYDKKMNIKDLFLYEGQYFNELSWQDMKQLGIQKSFQKLITLIYLYASAVINKFKK